MGHHVLYESIAVLQYHGTLRETGESGGHYTCDVKDSISKMWFKTNDDQEPRPIKVSDVSKYANVVLLKQKR